MTSTGSAKQPPEIELAALVHGLRHRGLAVGVDDAARIERLFRHAGEWSHQRRVRALKTLLARSAEERRILDQLAPFLFVDAEKRAGGRVARAPAAASPAAAGARKSPDPQERPSREEAGAPREDGKDSGKGRWRWWAGAVLLVGLVSGILWMSLSRRPPEPPADVPPPLQQQDPSLPLPLPSEASPPASEAPLASEQIEVGAPPPAPRWPFVLVLAIAALPVWWIGSRWWRASRQERKAKEVASSVGARSYRLKLPAARQGAPQDTQAVREAAFHLSAPTADAPAPWLDVRRTVHATVRNAGRLTLRWASWREHRPVLFIEDVSPSMACWPGFGRRLAAGMSRQGGDVKRYYMAGTPEVLSPDSDLRRRMPLEQVLAGLTEATVVVVSDAAALDRPRVRARVRWPGLFTRATWLHPGSVETWGAGARWLARRLRVVPMTDEGLLRLGSPRQGSGAQGLARWRPSRMFARAAGARAAGLRATLGYAAFWWLASGAVLDRIGALSAELWWALHFEGIAPAPRERIDRAWALAEVHVGAGGTVRLEADLREALLAVLREEKPELLSGVVKWAEGIVVADLEGLEERSLGAVEARALLARLLLVDPGRRPAARRQLKRLGDDGFGEWAVGRSAEETASRGRRRLGRTRRPPRLALAGAAVAALTVGLAGASLLRPEWRERIFPPRPDFRVLERASITPERPLRFYDFHQLKDDVWVRVGQRWQQAQRKPGFPTVWSLDWNAPALGDEARSGTIELYLGYDLPLAEEPWVVGLHDVVEVALTAPEEADVLGIVSLSWSAGVSGESSPGVWNVVRDGTAVARVAGLAYEDRPEDGAVWKYQVNAEGPEGRPYRSNVVEVRLPPVEPSEIAVAGPAEVVTSPPPVVLASAPPPARVDASPPEVGVDSSPLPIGPMQAVDSALLFKVVGLSDRISIVESSGSSRVLSTMEPLKPYFVLEDTGDSYRVSSSQEEGGIEGFVSKQEVAIWNTREGLRFVPSTFEQDQRSAVAAWDSEEQIRRYVETGDVHAYGPTFVEELQTRIGAHGIVPYPLLDTKVITDPYGKYRRIHQVLIPAIVAVETALTPQDVQDVAGAVTFCVVFDATRSMKKYAKEFAKTIDEMLSQADIDTERAAAGFVLFRTLKDEQFFELREPMPLEKASRWLRGATRNRKVMIGGGGEPVPVLDAMMLAQNRFLWNGGTGIPGARRIAIVVANKDARTSTVGLTSDIPKGLTAEDVGRRLLEARINVIALQAGDEDQGNLIAVLFILAMETGGKFYRAMVHSDEISRNFSMNLKKILRKTTYEEESAALRPRIAPGAGGGTVIALGVLDEDVKVRLKDMAREYHVSNVGLVTTRAWIFEEPSLYREEILIERELLEWLVRFFSMMTDSNLDATTLRKSMAGLLEALTGEHLREGIELQELLEKRLGIHFTTTLLSFDLDHLPTLDPVKRSLLQQRIREATAALAEFYERNVTRFNTEPRIWMPVSFLP